MALLNYSSNEALERIYLMLSGGANPADTEGTKGQMAFDEALTRIAQLLEGSNGTFSFPTVAAASTTAAGVVELADSTEANDETDNTVVLTPKTHSIAHEFGGIYVSTGTVNRSFAASTWSKITGSFQNEMEDSGETDNDWNDDRLVLNEQGMWFVQYNLSLLSDNGGGVQLRVRPYSNATAVTAAENLGVFTSSGTMNITGFAPVNVTTDNCAVDLRLYPASTINIQVASAQLFVRREVGVNT